MKNLLFLLSITALTVAYSQVLKFENQYFEKAILRKYPKLDFNKNGKIDKKEAESLRELGLMSQNLTNVNDIRFFKNLEYLSLTNNKIEKIKIENFPNLTKFYCARNNLKTFQISNIPKLQELACGRNQITEVMIKNCPNIESLDLMDNQISNLDLRKFLKLKYLVADNNRLKELDLSNNPELIQITINNNDITRLDLRRNINLNMKILYIDDKVQIIGNKNKMNSYRRPPTVIAK
ncbi:leucine-rich repeat domain-containing protein [Epilithonimonas mollis]|uniref:Leucine-rich repeat domain-containing protein n=1 Tax=Epilithonimonas mollis TaxID=216903 RepID=A0A1M6T8Q7_9FLAO|nr:hypothetical protein [Epilithonimonas mollis]SHK53118.1 hypothetical protein SAMN05444371_2704 [Epilithonimonas mollis]